MQGRIAIVGGGVMGASIALHAAQDAPRDLDDPVVLFERGEFGAGSSGRSGAVLRQIYADRRLIGMARDSLRYYRDLWARTGRWIGFDPAGCLTVAGPRQAEAQRRVREVVETMRSLGVAVELLDADGIRRVAPGFVAAPGSLGAFESEAATLDPMATVEALAALAREAGVVTRLGCAVRALRREGDAIVGLETDEGPFECRTVVLAAGAWSRRLLTEAGLDAPLVAVRPEQHFVAGLPPKVVDPEEISELSTPPQFDMDMRFAGAAESRQRSPHPVLLDLEHGHYARGEPQQGRARIGGLSYDAMRALPDPDALDEEVDAAFVRRARQALEARVPAYAQQADLGSQAAWYTLTPDAQPLLGPLPGVSGLLLVAGFSGHGFKLAPSIGEGIAQMLRGEPVSAFDTAFFDPARFSAADAARFAPATTERPGGAFGL